MAIQKTLSIIKPDAVSKGEAEKICLRLKEAGLNIIASKKQYQLSLEEAKTFYNDLDGKPFFDGLIQLMTSGPIDIHVLEGKDAINRYRSLMGSTNPKEAMPGTLRAEFGGKILPMNAVHGSDSPESAQKEISFFFKN